MEVLCVKKTILLSVFSVLSIGRCQELVAAHHTDATHEINQLAYGNQHKDDITEQVVLGNFANMVQNFFSIVQNPHNTAHVGANIAQMLAGIVNVAVEVIKSFPADADPEERAAFIKNIELSLKESLSTFVDAEKIL